MTFLYIILKLHLKSTATKINLISNICFKRLTRLLQHYLYDGMTARFDTILITFYEDAEQAKSCAKYYNNHLRRW